MLTVLQNTLWNIMNITAMALGTMVKDSRVLHSYENDSRQYTFQYEGNLPSPLWTWSVKILSTLFSDKKRPKKVRKRYKSLTY